MHEIAFDLLILLAGIWLVAVTLRPFGLPTVMGELIVGVLVGPAVLGWIEPSEAITLLAEIGIFFLMFHAGVETRPLEFFEALKRSLGVAIVGAIVPFSVSFGVATLFGLGVVGATFVGLTMTATAVVVTLKSLKDLGLENTRVARVIVASCVIDDLLTLVFFGLLVGVLSGGSFEPWNIAVTLGKVVAFFALSIALGRYVYPHLTLPFRSKGGKGFTFVLLVAVGAGLFAELIGLNMILGAYLAGLFFEEKVAHPSLVRVVNDRAYGIAYSFLGPIFFISLGFSITFDISASGVALLAILTAAVIVGQILSAGGMALRMGLPGREALTVGVGMCGRAELAFILASLALAEGAIGASIFSVLIFTCFILNLFTPLALKGCAVLLEGKAARHPGATRGVVQLDKFATTPFEKVPTALPNLEETVVIYGLGPEVEALIEELDDREAPTLILEEDEVAARRLLEHGSDVVHVRVAEDDPDLRPLADARALVLNGADDENAMLALGAREAGFNGPIVALIQDPHRRTPILLAGASAAFTPSHVLAGVIAARASPLIGPRLEGKQQLGPALEVAELRVHEDSPLARTSLADAAVRTRTGANIVGQWREDELHSPPGAQEPLEPGAILIAAGTPESILRLRSLARPLTRERPPVVVGQGGVGRELALILRGVGEDVFVIAPSESPGVDLVGDIVDRAVLERSPIAEARVVILALRSDSATALAAAAVRAYAPDVPIIAGVARSENVTRIQRAGADFTISLSQVSGQLLARHVLGETVSLQPRIKMVKVAPGRLAGRHPLDARVRERTGCTIVAVERAGELVMEFPESFRLSDDDALYLCGTRNALDRYDDRYPANRL